MPFGQLLSDHILTPLGMKRTAYEPAMSGDMARGYTSFGLSEPLPADAEAKGWAATAAALKLDYLWAALCMVGAVYFVFRNG